MSIQVIARELYRLRQEVERLERELHKASTEKRPDIEESLRKAQGEKKRLEDMLEGSKEPPKSRRPL